MSAPKFISIRGARVNNLKNVSLDLPRNQLIVVTGLSGSGKSSLAFDTLYAEGQRRYVESLSSYARQFLGRMKKPECDFIMGIPPAVAIEQKVISRNPRSTVGTSTEIYEYLRLLYARVGQTFSPVSGKRVKKNTVDDVIHCALSYSEGTRFTVLCPLKEKPSVPYLQRLLKMGFSRLEVDGTIARIDDLIAAAAPAEPQDFSQKAPALSDKSAAASAGKSRPVAGDVPMLHTDSNCYIVLDRLQVSSTKEALSRLGDSAETAFYEGDGTCLLRFYGEGGNSHVHSFSVRFEADGIRFEEPTDQMFSFNSPVGACPRCEGFGSVIGIDENLVVPNKSLSVYDGCVVCWRGEKMGEWLKYFIERSAKYNFPIFKPYYELTQAEKDLLWHGNAEVEGIDRFFQMVRENQYKIQFRVMLARYRGKTVCPECHGTRLRPEASYVKVGGKSLPELVDMPIYELREFFASLQLDEHDQAVARRILLEIDRRIGYLCDVGLGYLTLNRRSNTLSGGESQRINLATSLGSSLVGSLYILDEPSIGLHPRDTQRLIGVLRKLQSIGNTVVVVEHDEEIMRAADYLVDVGPEAGRNGGEIVYQGPVPTAEDLAHLSPAEVSRSHTVRFLMGQEEIPLPATRRAWNRFIEVKGARENNLKGIDVRFPLNVLTVVTGVSGSGKSTLVRDIFYRALKREYSELADRPGEFAGLAGDISAAKGIELVDQNPIGKSSRSNPATYLKVYDEIRRLMAEQPQAKQMGYTPAHFSFNAEGGGRCPDCKGEGTITIPMQFMADLVLPCEACHGKRFRPEILEVTYQGRNIYDMLEMTVDEAIDFFSLHGEERIVARLRPLADVGLGYVKLGQSSSTLSGGESQRVKLAYFLSQEKMTEPTIFVFDEPTTGLHTYDIRRLLSAFDALIGRGHTVVVIEHNQDVIKCADYVIDLGPEGGDKGGNLLFSGTPEQLLSYKESYTARFLAPKLKR
ncbi:MAG: excinuclease ABC subunit UvrA [Bacteroidaceae bacterium]|jgi:excinuclease ABC subunit A